MKIIAYAYRMMRARPGALALNVLLLTLGLASVTFLMLVNAQVQRAFDRDLAGIDVVVGAKGSPLQLILAGVLHVDVPSGNIALADVQELAKNPLIKKLIPLSLGDSFRGYRIVGTTRDYADHYGMKLASGRWWLDDWIKDNSPYKPDKNDRDPLKTVPQLPDVRQIESMQAVLGADVAASTQMPLGAQFAGNHGLGQGGEKHDAALYTVAGTMQPCGCVLDRLILTATESVWFVHEKTEALDEDDMKALKEAREVTLALIEYNSPLAAVGFPRFVNTSTDMQAAAPAVEITRLLRMLGVGTDVIRGFAIVLLAVSALSLLIALWNALRERRADLAMLRMLGASPAKIVSLLLTETLLMAALATVLGLLLGHLLTGLVGYWLIQDRSLPITGLTWLADEWLIPALAAGLAVLATVAPAWAAYRLDVLKLLQTR